MHLPIALQFLPLVGGLPAGPEPHPPADHRTLLVEAESFSDLGGWSVDTQFYESMGSPFLLAHGLGRPVADATTEVQLPGPGTWHLWARTYDWVERWGAEGAPGEFTILVDGERVGGVLGREDSDWTWQRVGTFEAGAGPIAVALHDHRGFDARCDALLFTTDPLGGPTEAAGGDRAWRRGLAGLEGQLDDLGPYDLVVVGGGASGCATAVSAARMGCRVALIQNRPVLGGNGSSEVRVWMKGEVRRGPFPRLGEIVEELTDRATASPGTADMFQDAKKEAIVRAEAGIDLFLSHHAFAVELAEGAEAAVPGHEPRVVQHDGREEPVLGARGERRIVAVRAFDVRTGVEKRFSGRLFADCTGHGVVGALAGAHHTLRADEHLGASNMWRWEQTEEPQPFPETPWALSLDLDDFPYPRRGHGEWFWESGFEKHPIQELEAVRDWNLRAVFGAFSAMKRGERAEEHANARLTWVAYVAGTRESRQLLGDVVLTQGDIVSGREFPDGCVPTTWTIDLHYPKEQYVGDHADNPFIAKAVHGAGVDRERGYPVPYRCFYSRNVPNLFLAGRCASVTHEALGTVRVMRTGGMMGEVVGKAASICVLRDCEPREVRTEHWDELVELMRLPGGSRRATPEAPLEILASPLWSDDGVPRARGTALSSLPGIVIDDRRARLQGDWKASTHEPGYVGEGYLHDGNEGKGDKRATFVLRTRTSGTFRIGLAWRTGGNRASNVPVTLRTKGGESRHVVDQRAAVPASGFAVVGEVELEAGEPVHVVIETTGTDGHVIVDAVQALRVEG